MATVPTTPVYRYLLPWASQHGTDTRYRYLLQSIGISYPGLASRSAMSRLTATWDADQSGLALVTGRERERFRQCFGYGSPRIA